MNYQIVLIIGIAGCYFIGAALEGFALRGSEQWGSEERQRVNARLTNYESLLRLLDMLGMAIIVVGLLRHYGALRFIPLTASRILITAVAVLCLERIARSWVNWYALREVEAQDVRVRGLLAALASTVLQIALALWVGWWVCTHVKILPPAGGGSSGGGTPSGQTTTSGQDTPTPTPIQPAQPPWMTETEALQLLGKEQPEYLHLLVRRIEGMFPSAIQMEKDGQTLYRRAYLEKYKAGGLPTIEELRSTETAPPAPEAPEQRSPSGEEVLRE